MYLKHYGIKGMKWGVRKEKLKKRLKEKQKRDEIAIAARAKKRIEKREFASSKEKKEALEKEKDNIKSTISKQRIAFGAAVLATAGVISYRAVRNYNFNKDVELKANSIIQRMTSKPERIDFSGKGSGHFVDIGRFYAATSKADARTYRVGFWNAKKLKNEYATTEKLKIAGQKTARKLFYEAGLGKQIAGSKTSFSVDKFAIKHPKVHSVLEAVMPLPVSFRTKTSKYDSFNVDLYKPKGEDSVVEKFYDVLRKKGYNGVVDVNDFSNGLHSNRPTIFFGEKVFNNLQYKGTTDVSFVSPIEKTIKTQKDKILNKYVYGLGSLSMPAAVALTANSVHKQNVINAKYYDEAMKTKIEDEKKVLGAK